MELEHIALRHLMPHDAGVKSLTNGLAEDFVGSDGVARESSLPNDIEGHEDVEFDTISFDIGAAVGDESSSCETHYIFRRMDEVVVAEVSYPGYCDENFDGYLNALRRVTQKDLEKEIRGLVDDAENNVMRYINDLRNEADGMIKRWNKK